MSTEQEALNSFVKEFGNLFGNLSKAVSGYQSTHVGSHPAPTQTPPQAQEKPAVHISKPESLSEEGVENSSEDEDGGDGISIPSCPWSVSIDGINDFFTVSTKFSVITLETRTQTAVVELFPDNKQISQFHAWLTEKKTASRNITFEAKLQVEDLDSPGEPPQEKIVESFTCIATIDAMELPSFDFKEQKPWTCSVQLTIRDLKFN